MTDDNQQFVNALVMMADLLSGRAPRDCGPGTLGVLVGNELEIAVGGDLSLVTRVREGAAYLETWALKTDDPEHPANGGEFKCYDDRRWQWTREGYAFGTIEVGNDYWRVWDKTLRR